MRLNKQELQAMLKNNQKIPEGWSVKKLGDIGKVSMCKRIMKHETNPISGIPFYKIGTFGGQPDAYISEKLYLEYRHKYSYPKKGDILISAAGTIGRTVVFNGENAYFQDSNIVWLANDETKALNKYLLFYYATKPWYTTTGGAISRLYNENITEAKVLLPPLAEQEKIAEILGTWDEAIEKLSSLIEQKKLLKKGLMQKLIYTRTNATKYKVADLFELGRGRVISKNEIDTHQGVFPVYSSQTSDNGILGYINTYDFQGEYITWTTDGANAGEVFYRNGKFNCTNVCGTAKAKEKNVNLYYAMSFLNHVSQKYVSYVGNPKLMNGVFAIIPLILPNIEIQNKVAEVLSTADDEIDLLNKKLILFKEQKKGLMQQLLTGQVRVKVN